MIKGCRHEIDFDPSEIKMSRFADNGFTLTVVVVHVFILYSFVTPGGDREGGLGVDRSDTLRSDGCSIQVNNIEDTSSPPPPSRFSVRLGAGTTTLALCLCPQVGGRFPGGVHTLEHGRAQQRQRGGTLCSDEPLPRYAYSRSSTLYTQSTAQS